MDHNLREELAAILTAAPPPPPAPEDVHFPAIDVSERAQKIRAIVRIADAYNWHSAIVHFWRLRASRICGDLTDPQLDDLLDRMHGYVDAAETGSSLVDCLPAS